VVHISDIAIHSLQNIACFLGVDPILPGFLLSLDANGASNSLCPNRNAIADSFILVLPYICSSQVMVSFVNCSATMRWMAEAFEPSFHPELICLKCAAVCIPMAIVIAWAKSLQFDCFVV